MVSSRSSLRVGSGRMSIRKRLAQAFVVVAFASMPYSAITHGNEALTEGDGARASIEQRELDPEVARKAALAASLAEYGEQNDDPYALVSAARLFADLDIRFARRDAPPDEDAAHPEQFYDAGQLLERALHVAAKAGSATENAIKPSVERVRAITGTKSGWRAGWHTHYRCVGWDIFGDCTYWAWVSHCHRGFC